MVERIKSIILTILILNSLLLSGLLWYKSPNVEEINHTDYIPQQFIGEVRQLEQLVLPRSLIYHSGAGHHWMSFAGDHIFDRITQALADGQFRQTKERTLTPAEWDHLLYQTPGWELRFPVSVPMTVLTERLYTGMEPMEKLMSIDRIWIYRQQNELKALIISDQQNRIYESQLIVNNEDTVFKQRMEVGLLSVLPVKEEVSGHPSEPIRIRLTYFPDRAVTMAEWEAPLQEIELEQMRNLLFLDPSLVRVMSDVEEEALIMQDGSRSVRFVETNRMLSYQNYKMKLEPKPIGDDLNEAIQFINQHGGWMAAHHLVGIDGSDSGQHANRYDFRLLHNGLPVYANGDDGRYGTQIIAESQGGHVLRYDRSLHFTADDEFMQQNDVAGGEEALDQLLLETNMAKVRDMFPAYQVIHEQEEGVLRYVPGWRLQFTNGDETWFEARMTEGGETNGLE